MKHPALIRDRVLARVTDMLEHLRVQISCYTPDEQEVLKTLERPQQFELAVEVANYVIDKLGHAPSEAQDQRFDKTRRALSKKLGRPPRGAKLAGDPTDADALEGA